MNNVILQDLNLPGIIPKNIEEMISKGIDSYKVKLEADVVKYRGIIPTEETLKGCKNVSKQLSALKKDIEIGRKTTKSALTNPAKVLDAKCRELMAVIDDIKVPLDNGIHTYDEQKKKEKEHTINGIIDTLSENESEWVKERIVFSNNFLNVATSIKSIEKDIVTQIGDLKFREQIIADKTLLCKSLIEDGNKKLINKINMSNFSFDFETANSSDIMTMINKLVEQRKDIENKAQEAHIKKEAEKKAKIEAEEKAKAESEMKAKAEAEEKAEEKAKMVEAPIEVKQIPPKKQVEATGFDAFDDIFEESTDKDSTYEIRITMGESKAKQLRDFMDRENIGYKMKKLGGF
jgi:hypothetical protein